MTDEAKMTWIHHDDDTWSLALPDTLAGRVEFAEEMLLGPMFPDGTRAAPMISRETYDCLMANIDAPPGEWGVHRFRPAKAT